MVVSATHKLCVTTAMPNLPPDPVHFLYCRPQRDETTRSLLALRTPEGRSAVLGEALHHAAAAAFLAFAVVDQKRVLEIAELARGLAMVAQRRAAGLDRLVQHRVNGVDQPFCVIGRRALAVGQSRGLAFGRQMRAIQRLADIDVAK